MRTMRRLLAVFSTIIAGMLLAAAPAFADGPNSDVRDLRIDSAVLQGDGSVRVSGHLRCDDNYFVVVRVAQPDGRTVRANGASPGLLPCNDNGVYVVSTNPATQTGGSFDGRERVFVSVTACTDRPGRSAELRCDSESARLNLR
jgi:hypothetical protein